MIFCAGGAEGTPPPHRTLPPPLPLCVRRDLKASHTIPECLALDQRYSVLPGEPETMIKEPLLQLVGSGAFFTAIILPSPPRHPSRRSQRTVADVGSDLPTDSNDGASSAGFDEPVCFLLGRDRARSGADARPIRCTARRLCCVWIELESLATNDVRFELSTFLLHVRKARGTLPLLSLAFLPAGNSTR